MKILIFLHTYFPFVGGAEMAVKEITDRLGQTSSLNRFEFDLITAKLDKKLPSFEKIGNINVYRVGQGWILDKYFYPWLAYFKAKKLHKERNYQIIEAIMATYGGIAALFFKWKYPKIKYLLNMQSGDSDFFIWLRTWFWYPIYKMVYTKADFIQPISKWLEKRARKYGYKGEIKVVPNGINFEKFQISDFTPSHSAGQGFQISEFRKKLGINNEDEKIIIHAGRLVKKNAINDLIKAITYLPKELKVKLILLGDGKDRNKLENLARRLKLENKILFLGKYDNNELPEYLWLSDIFCRPSLSEGLGISFLEAMAAGVPVIATPVGGIPDFLKDKETGLFCQVNNPKSIAEAITKLLNDSELYNKIVENSVKLVKEKYDWEKIAGEMRGIYVYLKNKI